MGRKRRTAGRSQTETPSERRAAAAARRRAQRAAELETIIAGLEQRLGELGNELETVGAEVERVRLLGEEYAQVEADLNRHLSEWASLAEA